MLKNALKFCLALVALSTAANASMLGFKLEIFGVNGGTGATNDRPDIRITNTSTFANADLTRFQMTIGRTSANFDFAIHQQTLPSNSGATSVPGKTVNVPDTLSNNVGADQLDISFTGFNSTPASADESVRFRLDIDNDVSPDVPTNFNNFIAVPNSGIFFNNGAEPNSVVTVTFLYAGHNRQLMLELPDQLAVGNSYTFEMMQNPIPEPGTMTMLAAGVLIIAAARFRRSR